MQVARPRVSRTGKLSCFFNFVVVGTVQRTLGEGGCGREIFASATCSLQFAKASAATPPQQGNNNSSDLQRGRVNISSFIGTVASWPSRRCTLDEFKSLAVSLWRALQH
jgi:hypothetical protein